MPLSDLIEIIPLDKPVRAEITVPGSKSITNRALVLAALAEGETTLHGALWSEDTQVMVEALSQLGFQLKVETDPEELCNRIIIVKGQGGQIPKAGTPEKPLELFVGNAGTAARFLAALVCLGEGVYRLHGVPRMHERPQAELFQALRELGYEVEGEKDRDKLPARIIGSAPSRGLRPRFDLGVSPFTGPGARSCSVSITSSSQFASALLLCAKVEGWNITILGENPEESPYVEMTSKLIKAFPEKGSQFQIEPDASSGSYFFAAAYFVLQPEELEYSRQFGVPVLTRHLQPVQVAHWPDSDWQIDQHFPQLVKRTLALHFGLEAQRGTFENDFTKELQDQGLLKDPLISRNQDLGDSIMMAIVLAPFALKPIRFTDLGRLRVQECERVIALRTELAKCGAEVVEEADTLTVFPSKLHGAEIETYNDHRMAMCFAILGLKVPGIRIKNPSCVKKTFPNFFQKLAAPAPKGLGARILDVKAGQDAEFEDLFAE